MGVSTVTVMLEIGYTLQPYFHFISFKSATFFQSYLQQGNPAIAVKCAYSAPDTCQALAATTMTTTAGTAMNLPAMGGLLLTIAVIIMNFF